MIILMDSINGNISLSGNQVAWIVAWVVLKCVQGIPTQYNHDCNYDHRIKHNCNVMKPYNILCYIISASGQWRSVC